MPLCHPAHLARAACFVGYGHHHGASACEPCGPGTAKNLVGSKECDYCLDGFVANSNLGATDCLDVGAGRRKLLQAADPRAADEACEEALETDVDEPAVYIADENSCGCPAWSVLRLPQVEYDEDLDWEVVPARCVAECPTGLVFSIDGEPEVGLTKCFTCPANSRAAPDARSCVCNANFIPRANFKVDGCRARPAPAAPAPGAGGNGGDDDEDEWGHWSHKKDKRHGKHGEWSRLIVNTQTPPATSNLIRPDEAAGRFRVRPDEACFRARLLATKARQVMLCE